MTLVSIMFSDYIIHLIIYLGNLGFSQSMLYHQLLKTVLCYITGMRIDHLLTTIFVIENSRYDLPKFMLFSEIKTIRDAFCVSRNPVILIPPWYCAYAHTFKWCCVFNTTYSISSIRFTQIFVNNEYFGCGTHNNHAPIFTTA